MLRRSPRAALLWAAAAIAAVTTAVIVVTTLSSLRHQDETFGRLHPMVVARRDLPVGDRLGQSDVMIRTVRGASPEPDTLARTPEAVGRIVRVPILRGAAVTARHLTPSRRSGLSGVIPADTRAVRVVIEHGLRPAPGDLVDVYATFDPQTLGDGLDPTILVAPAVTVIAVDSGADAALDSVGLTLLVTPRQAGRLAFSVTTGTLSLALAPPEAAARD